MGNEKMNNLPGTPGWIAANMGQKKHAEEENIEKEASSKDVAGKLAFGRKNYKDLMEANEKFGGVGDRRRDGNATEEELDQAREEYEPTRKRAVKSLKTRLALATATPFAIAAGLETHSRLKNHKKK